MQNCPRATSAVRRSTGFTLIELLVVIGIIVVLIGILLPVISKVRTKAYEADTKNWINELGSAIDRYQQDFRAYPGPLANDEIDLVDDTSAAPYTGGFGTFGYPANLPTNAYDTTTQDAPTAAKHFTMSENLVLGLLGGFHIDVTTATQLDYDPSAVGGGPTSLSRLGTAINKRYPPYIDSKQLSWQTTSLGKTGHFQDESGSANDSIIPEFVDRFVNPMPILYMRAKVGTNPQPGDVTAGVYSNYFNPIVTNDLNEMEAPTPPVAPNPGGFAVRKGAYDISQIIGYTGAFIGAWPTGIARDTASPPTGTSIGIGKSANPSRYTVPPNGQNLYHGFQMTTWTAPPYPPTTPTLSSQYPYDAYPYLVGSSGSVREKDGYILISAGADRVYGTEDDICNFGSVTP